MTDKGEKKKKSTAEQLIAQGEERLKARFIGTKNKNEDAVKYFLQAAALYKMEGDCAFVQSFLVCLETLITLLLLLTGQEAGDVLVKAASVRETKVLSVASNQHALQLILRLQIPDDDCVELYIEAAQCYTHSDTKGSFLILTVTQLTRFVRRQRRSKSTTLRSSFAWITMISPALRGYGKVCCCERCYWFISHWSHAEIAALEEETKNFKGAYAAWERAVDCYEAETAKA
jgi:hypothetical protein